MTERATRLNSVAVGWALGWGAAVFLFLTRTAEQYGDSLNYARAIKTGEDLFHPHHLLYNPVVRGLYKLLSIFIPGLTALDAAQIHNIFWAALVVVVLFRLAERRLGSVGGAVGTALGLLVSLGFWEYSTQAQIYVPALGPLALIALMVFGRPDVEWRTRDWVRLGLLYVLAMLYHQTNVLLFIPLAVFVAARFDRRSRARFFGAAAAACAAVGVLYGGAFVLASGGETTITGFFRYVLHYRFHPDPQWGTIRNVGPQGLGYLLFSQLRDIIPVVDPFQKAAVFLFGAAVAGLLAWSVARITRRGWRSDPGRLFLLVWLIVHFLFFLWWSPQEKNMFILSLFPLILLTALAVGDLRNSARGFRPPRAVATAVGAGLILSLAAVNYASFVRPRHLSRGPDFEEARRLDACVPRGDFILSNNEVHENLRYYSDRREVLIVEIAPMSICRNLSLPADYDALRASSFVLSPDYVYPDSRLSIISGYDEPRGWRRFLEWLFAIETDARGVPRSCREFGAFICGRGYLRVGLTRVPIEGWADLLARLDRLAAERFGAPPGVFGRWAAATGEAGGGEREN